MSNTNNLNERMKVLHNTFIQMNFEITEFKFTMVGSTGVAD